MDKKRCIIGILIAIMIFTLVGCKAPFPIEAYQNYESDQQKIYVAFSKGDEEGEPIDYREIADYRSKYDAYNSRIMYNTLTDAQKQIYHIFEYAMDKECTTIFFDSRLISDIGLTTEEIFQLYTVDSPMVQQNYSCTTGETGYTFSYLWELFSFDVRGEIFTIENFSHEYMQKKKEAVSAAKKIVASMPKGLTQLEKARYFYRYLTRNVKYVDNTAKPNLQSNLYDALVLKKTQCDGYANAFSLLCAMEKIPCAEKVIYGKNEDEVGHTWNVFCADGVWYNADLALSEDYAEFHKKMDIDFSFGFSDAKVNDETDFSERFPKCKTDLIPVDYMASSPTDPQLISSIRNAFKKSGKRFVYIGLKKGELKTSDLQRIANRLYLDIYTLDENIKGKNYYYIFKD